MRASILVVLLAALAAAFVAILVGPLSRPSQAAPLEVSSALEPALALARSGVLAPAPSSEPAAPSAPSERADAHFVRWYRSPLAGGLLTFPRSFASADGGYDLVVHFNGNTDLVEESFEHANLNAVVVILNLGVGSGLYEDRFEDPAAFQLILDRVQRVMTARGLKNARLRRVAVSAWSSGYGGVIRVLQSDVIADRIDGVILFDALHCGYVPGTKTLKPGQIDPIVRFAKRAAEGRALLSITHSKIETYGYLNAQRTADVIIDAAHALRSPTTKAQPMPDLRSMIGVLPKALMVPLSPLSEAHRGGLHVRGYGGGGPVTHMLHLVQMSKTALPDLVERWSGAPSSPAH